MMDEETFLGELNGERLLEYTEIFGCLGLTQHEEDAGHEVLTQIQASVLKKNGARAGCGDVHL